MGRAAVFPAAVASAPPGPPGRAPTRAGRRPGAAGDRAAGHPGSRRCAGAAARRATLALGSPRRRVRIAMLCVGFALSLVAGRLIQVQVMEGPFYRAQADQFRLSTTPVPAMRGSITTADGTTLAMTVQTDQVTADPPTITAAKASLASVASALAGPLGMTSAAILAKLQHPTSQQWVLLKQSIPAAAASRISALGEPGITLTPTYSRVYPNGDLAANIVGFANTNSSGDLVGRAGVEEVLQPAAGRAGR